MSATEPSRCDEPEADAQDLGHPSRFAAGGLGIVHDHAQEPFMVP